MIETNSKNTVGSGEGLSEQRSPDLRVVELPLLVSRILAQERTQHQHRAPLNREPEPVLITTLIANQPQSVSIQPEEPLKLER